MADNYHPSDPHGAEYAAYSTDAEEYTSFAVDGEFYAIGFPDEAEDGPDSSVATPLPPPHLLAPHALLPPGAEQPGAEFQYVRPPNTFDHAGTAFYNLNTSSPLFSPNSHVMKSPARAAGATSDEDVFPDSPYTQNSAHPHPPSPQQIVAAAPQVGPPAELPRIPSVSSGPPAGSPPQTAGTLVETILPAPGPSHKSLPSSPEKQSSSNAPGRCNSLRKVGTVKRTMSMRGGKPRVMKIRVVNKTDSKSYFSVERTMYQWIYMSAVILGNALTFYGVIHPDLKIVQVAHISATLLSFLAIVVAYYAAIYAFRRRMALNRQAEAAAFDDRFGPIGIVAVIIIVFVAAESLTLRSAIKNINGKSFGLKQAV